MVQKPIKIEKIFAWILAVSMIMIVAFYFLADDQLHLRESRRNVMMLPADASPHELCTGTVYEQHFVVKMNKLQTLCIQWGTYARQNVGNIYVELVDGRSGEILISDIYDASGIWQDQVTVLTAEMPIDDVYGIPLIIRLYSDSPSGASVTPVISSAKETEEGYSLTVSGEEVSGRLCFSASGLDFIWTGLHYWELAGGLLVGLMLFCAIVIYRDKRGKHSYVVAALVAIQKYRFLIRQLVGRDFKTKYKRSILGVFWSFLNPLLTMCVQYFVFSSIFRQDILNFPAYLIIGTVAFNFFSEACGMSLTSVLGNAGLLTKVYMPKYIYPLTRTMSSGVNLLISLIPMLLVCLFTGVHFKKSAILSLFFLVCLFIFTLGLGMLLSASMVFFRDTQFLWSVVNMIWMYATPIFYPESILSDGFRIVLTINPLYHFIKNIRLCILNGISPEPFCYAQCFIIALGMLLIGSVVFKKTQDKFILYL